MAKKIIKSKAQAFFGQVVNFPVDGEVKIEKDGTLEVSEELAELLLQSSEYEEIETKKSKSTEKSSSKKAKKVEEEEDDENEDEEDSEEEENDSEDDEEDSEEEDDEEEDDEEEDDEEDEELTKEQLSEMEVEDLVEILKDAGIPEKKYEKLITKKGLLVNYILKNVQK